MELDTPCAILNLNGDQMKKWKEYFNSVQWKWATIYILLLVITMQLIGVYFFRSLEKEYTSDLELDLQSQGNLLHAPVKELLSQKLSTKQMRENANTLLTKLVYLKLKEKTTPNIEIQIIDKEGFILSTTATNKNVVGNKNILLNQFQGKAEDFRIRRDPFTGKDSLIYVHEINNDRGINIGTIYMEASLEKTYQSIRSISKHFIQITGISMAITALLMIILARTITTPIKEITEQATAMSSGDFNRQVDVRSDDEIGRLGHAFNDLASDLREALSQKEEEKKKLSSVLANMSDGVIATDTSGHIMVKNQQAEKLLGHTIDLDQPIQQILPLEEPMPIPLRKQRQAFIELQTDEANETMIIKVTFTPIKKENQEIVGTVAVLQNITEQEMLDRQRKEFVANVSHELRTPLTTIKSYLEALDDGAMHEPEIASQFLKVTRQEADRMTRLINDLLQLSRLDAKKVRFHKQRMDISDLLSAAVDRFSVQAQQKSIQLSLKVQDHLPDVYVDPDKMNQVLDNLMSNAIKYTPETGKVQVKAKSRDDGQVEVSITDTGIGIPQKDLERIFERFYRVDKARSRNMGGTGLGLAIAQEIIRAHEGNIFIESEYQKGTTVSFTLPPCQSEVKR